MSFGEDGRPEGEPAGRRAALPGPPRPPGIVHRGFAADREVAPYFGPEPPPSRRLVGPLLTACGALVLVYTVRAVLYLQRRSLDLDELAVGRTASIYQRMVASAHLLQVSSWAIVVGWIGTGLLYLTWTGHRRPRAARVRGDVWVELPLTWTIPHWLRLSSLGLLVAAFTVSLDGQVPVGAPLSAYPDARRLQAVGSGVWAAFWIMVTLRPLVADRAQDRRAEWSRWYRQDLGSGRRPRPTLVQGEGEGIGWVLRTAALVVVLFISMTVTIAVAAELIVGQVGQPGLRWLVPALIVDGLVGWTFVRRRRRVRSAGSVDGSIAPAAPSSSS